MQTSEPMEQDERPWWHRVRSAVLLVLLLVGLGAATAAVLGVAALAITTLFDRALG